MPRRRRSRRSRGHEPAYTIWSGVSGPPCDERAAGRRLRERGPRAVIEHDDPAGGRREQGAQGGRERLDDRGGPAGIGRARLLVGPAAAATAASTASTRRRQAAPISAAVSPDDDEPVVLHQRDPGGRAAGPSPRRPRGLRGWPARAGSPGSVYGTQTTRRRRARRATSSPSAAAGDRVDQDRVGVEHERARAGGRGTAAPRWAGGRPPGPARGFRGGAHDRVRRRGRRRLGGIQHRSSSRARSSGTRSSAVERRQRHAAGLDVQDAVRLDGRVAAAAARELRVTRRSAGRARSARRRSPTARRGQLGGVTLPRRLMTRAPIAANQRIRRIVVREPGGGDAVAVDEPGLARPPLVLVRDDHAGALPEDRPRLGRERHAAPTRAGRTGSRRGCCAPCRPSRRCRPPGRRSRRRRPRPGRCARGSARPRGCRGLSRSAASPSGEVLERADGRRAVGERRIGGDPVRSRGPAGPRPRSRARTRRRTPGRRPSSAASGSRPGRRPHPRPVPRARSRRRARARRPAVRRDLQEQRLLEGHRHVPLLEHDPASAARRPARPRPR